MRKFSKIKIKNIIPRLVRVCSASSPRRGFTLVELLVTISMFVILTGVVLLNSKNFDNSILLKNFTYDVALTIRQAQSYGVNVRESNTGSFNKVNQGYGVYFDINSSTGSDKNFILFNDTGNSPDKKYNDAPNSSDVRECDVANSECIQKYSMTKGTKIVGMCVGVVADCPDGIYNTKQLSILFYRPKLEAKIYSWNDSGTKSSDLNYAKITLSSAGGATSTINITSVGQIYVK